MSIYSSCYCKKCGCTLFDLATVFSDLRITCANCGERNVVVTEGKVSPLFDYKLISLDLRKGTAKEVYFDKNKTMKHKKVINWKKRLMKK